MQSLKNLINNFLFIAYLLPIILFGYAFYVLNGIWFWLVFLGYPLAVGLCLTVFFTMLRGPVDNDSGQAGGALFVASMSFLFLMGWEIFGLAGAWVFHLMDRLFLHLT